MSRTLNKANYAKALEYVNANVRITEFAHTHNINIGKDNRLECCPFHEDSTPSFAVNAEENLWNCFGCQQGGSFIQFYREWLKKYSGRYDDKEVFNQTAMEDFLNTYPEVAYAMGIDSIYSSYVEEVTVFTKEGIVLPFTDEVRTLEQVDTVTLKAVKDKVKTRGIDEILAFIADCQQGANHAQLIRRFLYGEVLATPSLNIVMPTEDTQRIFSDIYNEELEGEDI